jgi:TQXA domain-containing protein
MKAIRKLGILLISVCMLLGMMPASLLAEADTAGQVDYTVEWVSVNKIKISYSGTKEGYLNYMVKEAGSEEPTQQEVLKANDYFPSIVPAKSDSKEVSVETSSAKDVYLVFHEGTAFSKTYYKMTKISLPSYKSSSTAIEGGAVEAGSVSFSAARKNGEDITLSFTPTVSGTLYYMAKGESEAAPTDEELKAADKAAGTANVEGSVDIKTGSDEAKKVYVLYISEDGTKIGSGEISVPIANFKAEVKPTTVSLGTIREDYTSESTSGKTTVTNKGNTPLSFEIDKTADGYSTFSEYFTVDTSEVQDLKAGKTGSVTIRPKEGLAPGKTYTASFKLVDDLDGKGSLTLGPVTVSVRVVAKGDSMPDGIRTPDYKYTPRSENVSGGSDTTDTNRVMMDGRVVYCVNYHFNLYNSNYVMDKYYDNKFGKLANVTTKEFDAYTGLNLNREQLYPPNDRGFTPVKEGSTDSAAQAKKDNVKKVLYNGYGSDAANIKGKYDFNLAMDTRQDYAFEIATQCAIWYYTDTDDNGNTLTFEKLKAHIKNIYSTVPSWGWDDIENIYKILTGQKDYEGIELQDPSADYEMDLYIAKNPINDVWTQNLVGGVQVKGSTVKVTKVWNDNSNADSIRPTESEFKSWLHLYKGGVSEDNDVTSKYSGNLTITDNGDGTYTASWTDLDGAAETYTVREIIPEGSSYKVTGSNIAVDGGNIINTHKSTTTKDISVRKVWKGSGNKPSSDDFKTWLKLYKTDENGREQEVTGFEPEITEGEGEWTVTYKGLPQFDSNNKEIVYYVKETIPEGQDYSASYANDNGRAYDGGVITNTSSAKTSVSASKTWKNSDGSDISAPAGAEITFTLCRNGKATDKKVVLDGTPDENGEKAAWTAEWTGLDKYDADGNEISYSVFESEGEDGYVSSSDTAEKAVSGTGASVENTKIGGTSVQLKAKKFLVGLDQSASAGQFTFDLYKKDSDGNYKKIGDTTNGANGEIVFAAQDYTYEDAGKTFEYKITERSNPEVSTITYDSTVYYVTVKVNQNGSELSTDVKYEKSVLPEAEGTRTAAAEITFTNRCNLTDSVKWHIDAVKETSDGSKLSGGEFLFEITDADGNPYYMTPDGKLTTEKGENNTLLQATNDADGKVVFPEIVSTEEKDFELYIRETGCADSKDEAKWSIDDTSRKVNVSVKKNSENKLEASVDYTGGKTFTNTRKTVSLNITKSWDGISAENRPVSVSFNIMRKAGADGKAEKADTVTLSDPWTLTVDGLPASDGNGNDYIYSVEEVNDSGLHFDTKVVYGADTVMSGVLTKNVSVTNSKDSEKTKIAVKKEWADGTSGEKAVVELLADGKKTGKQLELNEVNYWKGEFTGLDKYSESGKEIDYSVKEVSSNYDVSIEKSEDGKTFTVTNSRKTEKTEVKVEKKWGEGVTGETADIELKRDGKKADSVTLSSENEWKHTFSGLDKYASDGHEYRYTVEETNENYTPVKSVAEDGTIVITNYRNTELTSVKVNKVWADGATGEKAVVELLADGEKTGKQLELNEVNDWKGEFTKLDKYRSNGEEIKYTVEEITNDYDVTIEKNADGSFTVTNSPKPETPETPTEKPEKVNVPVEKKWAEGASGEKAVVELLADGTETGKQLTLTESNSWKGTFTDLDKYDSSKNEIKYTVKEITNDYRVTIEKNADGGFTVTNYPKENTGKETVDIPVEKKWADGAKGEEAVFVLVKNGEETGKKLVLNEDNNWKGSFEDLDKYDENGDEIEYSIKEKTSKFRVVIESDGNGGYIVTNYPHSNGKTDKPNDSKTDKPTKVQSNGPKTGDESDIMAYILLLVTGAAAAAILLYAKKREEK